MSKSTGGCAYPSMDYIQKNTDDPNHYRVYGDNGMTLRDHFAGLAMQGLLSNEGQMEEITCAAHEGFVTRSQLISEIAYGIADAMLVRRER